MRFLAACLLMAGLSGAPALAQTSYMTVFATPERVYFLDTSSASEGPPTRAIRTFVAIDPPLNGGISAREMTVSVDCAANTFTITALVSLDRELKQLSTDPGPTAVRPVDGPFVAVRDYVCDGKIPSDASRYETRGLALDAGLRIIAANRTDPARQ